MSQAYRALTLFTALATAVCSPAEKATAETNHVRLVEQYGVHYLPLPVVIEHKLIQKHAAKLGITNLDVSIVKLSGAAAVNDALLSGNVDFVAVGTGGLLKMWDKTKGTLDVKAVSGLVCLPMKLNSNRPEIKSLKDLTDTDRIAVPSVKVSMQAVVLQMAAKKLYGDPTYFDARTISMKHPDAVASLLSGQSHITAHFTVPPFHQIELRDKAIHTVASSYEIVGGKHTQVSMINTKKFKEENPKVFQAVYNALEEAMEIIKEDKKAAAALYIKASGSKEDPAVIEEIINDPDMEFTTTPMKVMEFATFLHEMGGIKNKPESWKDMYWETAHEKPGN